MRDHGQVLPRSVQMAVKGVDGRTGLRRPWGSEESHGNRTKARRALEWQGAGVVGELVGLVKLRDAQVMALQR